MAKLAQIAKLNVNCPIEFTNELEQIVISHL
jgi:hypothetical protein